MLRTVLALIPIMLASCAGGTSGGSALFLTPHDLSDVSCEEIARRESTAAARVKISEGLMAKANQDPAGPVVNAVVYAPDYKKALWDYEIYKGESERRNCPPAPEAKSAGAQPPSPRNSTPLRPAQSKAAPGSIRRGW
jgi:hypothetical protein